MNDFEAAAAHYSILDHAPIGQFVLRNDFSVLFWNRCMESWTGVTREELVGTVILDRYPHLGSPKYAQRIAGIFNGGPPAVFSSQLHRYVIPAPLPGGKLRCQYTVVTAIPDRISGSSHAMFAIQDVTSLTEAIENHGQALQRAMAEMEERKKAETKLLSTAEELKRLNKILKERSIRDGLTGLFNHHYFYQVLHRDFLLATRAKSDLACVLIDLDFFKHVNDSYGHPSGDLVLKKVASLIRRSVRKTDVVARYGGEEFAVLLPNTDIEGAMVIAEHIRLAIARHPFQGASIPIQITASFGVATRQTHLMTTPQELLAGADHALYQAKNAGRNSVRAFRLEDSISQTAPS